VPRGSRRLWASVIFMIMGRRRQMTPPMTHDHETDTHAGVSRNTQSAAIFRNKTGGL
jgi:hypothetical protein